jgi:hypothetical protein
LYSLHQRKLRDAFPERGAKRESTAKAKPLNRVAGPGPSSVTALAICKQFAGFSSSRPAKKKARIGATEAVDDRKACWRVGGATMQGVPAVGGVPLQLGKQAGQEEQVNIDELLEGY